MDIFSFPQYYLMAVTQGNSGILVTWGQEFLTLTTLAPPEPSLLREWPVPLCPWVVAEGQLSQVAGCLCECVWGGGALHSVELN